MATIKMRPGQLGAVIRATAKRLPQEEKRAAMALAQRSRTYLASVSPVNLGVYKNAWTVSFAADGATVTNTAPYAGIIERGARPHAVSREGIDAIAEWARRKLGLDATEARSMAFAIAQKLKTQGQPGLHLVENAMPQFREWARDELRRAVARTVVRSGTSQGTL